MTPQLLFDRWYVKPIEKLKELPNGDGGFAALMVALPLYDRFIAAKLKLDGAPTDDAAVRAEMAGDLQLSNDEARRFRAVIRNGFMHQGMGLAGPTQWATSHIFTERPRFQVVRGVSTICLDPWKFADRVLREFQMRPELIAISESFPLATITTFEKSDFETVPNNSVEPTPEKRRGSR